MLAIRRPTSGSAISLVHYLAIHTYTTIVTHLSVILDGKYKIQPLWTDYCLVDPALSVGRRHLWLTDAMCALGGLRRHAAYSCYVDQTYYM